MLTEDQFEENWDTWVLILQKRLKKTRFEHSLSVSSTAFELAEKHGFDVKAAAVAGLLHDYARNMKVADLLSAAKQKGLLVHPIERQVPILLHGPVGAELVKGDLGIADKEITEAIAYHTTAAPGMSGLTGLVYLADMIEPLRDFPGVNNLRDLARHNLSAAVLAGLESSIAYCMEAGLLIHPISIEARNYMLGTNKT